MASPRSDIGGLTHRGLAVLGVRLLALYILSRGVLALGGGRTAWQVGLPVILALLLWVSVRRIADWMVAPRRGATVRSGDGDAQTLGALAFGVLGLMLLCEALVQGAVAAILYRRAADPDPVTLVAPGMELILGAAVFFGARGLSAFIVWLRRAGG